MVFSIHLFLILYLLTHDGTSCKLALAGVILEEKNEDERFKLINNLDEDDKNTIIKIIDKMLTTKKFKEFFDKNMASL